MRLVDREIRELCEGRVPNSIRAYYSIIGIELPGEVLPLVEPFNPELVNPASLDIRIGTTAIIQDSDGNWEELDLTAFNESDRFWLLPHPQERILVSSLETFNLPNFLAAIFKLKSSRAREFYQHMLAGYCDPGWHGSKLTMELVNLSGEPLPLYPGLKIGQMAFDLTFGLPDRDYATTGRYNKDAEVSGSKG